MKKIFAFVLAMAMVATLFAGCSAISVTDTAYDPEKDAVVEVENGSVVEPEFADLVQIPGYDYLYYSTTDLTVYYLFSDSGHNGYSYGFFGPRIINGNGCKYVNGEIVEVIPTVRIEDTTN